MRFGNFGLFQVVGVLGVLLAAQGPGPARPEVPESLRAPAGEEVILAAQELPKKGGDKKNMAAFIARSVVLTGRIEISASIEQAFPMFSPLGEKLWVPAWDPELLYPPGASWEEGLLFRTREETGDAVWIVTRLDVGAHRVIYHRVEPGRYVARIEVRCNAVAKNLTEAITEYSFVGLSESGNQEIAAMTQDSYNKKMGRWSEWIHQYFQHPSAR